MKKQLSGSQNWIRADWDRSWYSACGRQGDDVPQVMPAACTSKAAKESMPKESAAGASVMLMSFFFHGLRARRCGAHDRGGLSGRALPPATAHTAELLCFKKCPCREGWREPG